MSDLEKAFSKENLLRAWKWLNTNPSISYKNNFRDTYLSYSFNYKENLSELSVKLKSSTYNPKTPGLVLQPKTSCTTRPITLLCIEDQIVYQALINIVAEKTQKKFHKRYLISTFGNLYAGKNQPYFYQNWQKCYRAFNHRIKDFYKEGYNYFASFDLTSCYDSIDHKVLGLLLEQNNIDKEFSDFLLKLLSYWSTNKMIYKGHGIPQGPMSSGLLSEVMLCYLDEQFEKQKLKNVQYLRYVDDIVLMGKSKEELTYALSTLDYRSKLIGLFPQSSKIKVKFVTNIEDELNMVSEIENEILISKIVKKTDKLKDKFKQTFSNNQIVDKTKFKMILSSLDSDGQIAYTSLKLLVDNPQYYESISAYLRNYSRVIPSKSIDLVIDIINSIDTYQITKAFLIDAVYDKLKKVDYIKFCDAVNNLNSVKNKHPYLCYVITKFKLYFNELKYNELINEIKLMKSWWAKKSILKYIDIDVFGEPSYYEILSYYLCDLEDADCSIEASKMIIENNIVVRQPYSKIYYIAQQTLRTNGLINKAKSRPSIIPQCIEEIASLKNSDFNWKKVFTTSHNTTEIKFIRAKTYYVSDITAFVNILDTINDLLLDALTTHDTSIGTYNIGNMGGFLSPTSAFSRKYPLFYKLCNEIHNKRLESDLSHPIVKKTKQVTRFIPYKYKYEASKLMRDGIEEYIRSW